MSNHQSCIFYNPSWFWEWIFLDPYKELSINDDDLSFNNETASLLEINGLWDHHNINLNMKLLLMKLEISDKATNLLVKNISDHAWIDIDLTNAYKEIKDTLTQTADANNQEGVQVIYWYLWIYQEKSS